MNGWIITAIYFGIGYVAALDLGKYARERQKSATRNKVRNYPVLYSNLLERTEEQDLELDFIIMMVAGGLFCWPIVWPVAHIVRMITHEREPT